MIWLLSIVALMAFFVAPTLAEVLSVNTIAEQASPNAVAIANWKSRLKN